MPLSLSTMSKEDRDLAYLLKEHVDAGTITWAEANTLFLVCRGDGFQDALSRMLGDRRPGAKRSGAKLLDTLLTDE